MAGEQQLMDANEGGNRSLPGLASIGQTLLSYPFNSSLPASLDPAMVLGLKLWPMQGSSESNL